MFRRQNKLDAPSPSTVQKSKSMEVLSAEGGGDALSGKRATSVDTVLSAWQELAMLKLAAPCVTCLLPHLSEDLVSSALLAIGATPLTTEGTRPLCVLQNEVRHRTVNTDQMRMTSIETSRTPKPWWWM